ncbi:hypothetical protein ACTG9Q_30415 [Actinokineospora sp. 24-640]
MNRTPDDDPFATGGHGRFLDNGVAPPVIGGPPADETDETVRVTPREVAYDREPPTSPIPAQPQGGTAGTQKKPGFFGKLFGRG